VIVILYFSKVVCSKQWSSAEPNSFPVTRRRYIIIRIIMKLVQKVHNKKCKIDNKNTHKLKKHQNL